MRIQYRRVQREGGWQEGTHGGLTSTGDCHVCLCFSQDPIKPHEKRALNFLSHEYLMQQDLKLTAITLTEENGDQVGMGRVLGGREGGVLEDRSGCGEVIGKGWYCRAWSMQILDAIYSTSQCDQPCKLSPLCPINTCIGYLDSPSVPL